MTSEKFRPSKKKSLRYFLITIFPLLMLSLAIGAAFSNEQISETESIMHFDLFFIIFIPTFTVLSLLFFGIFYGIYKNEKFYFDDNKIIHEFTFIIKRQVSLPLEKINIVKIKRNLIDLITGTSSIEIGSGSMSTSLKAEIKLCLNKQFAIFFTDYLQRYSKSVKEGKEFNEIPQMDETISNLPAQENSEDKISIKMTIADKFKYVFTSPILITTSALIILIPMFMLYLNVADPNSFIDSETLEKLSNIQAVIIGLFISVFITICGIIGAILHAFIGFYDYRIEKNDDGVKISYGLINKKSFLVTFDKIHGYVISRNLFRQIFNLGNIRLCVVGIDEQQGQNNGFSTSFLYPCGNIKRLNEIIDTFIPTYKFKGTLNKSTKKSMLHTILIPVLTAMVILLPILLYLAIEVDALYLIIPFSSLIICGGIRRLFVYKNAAFGIENNFVCTQNGGFLKNYSVIKTSSVQEISTFAGFIRRQQNLCSYLVIYRGANIFTSRIVVRNVPKIELDDLK